MTVQKPFNLVQWIENNKHLLQPPVGNKNLYVNSGDYIVMIVAGPNARKDFHYNETEELFYQLEGNITVYIQENGEKKAMQLGPGDMFLLPAKIPHSPVREKNSIGLVIEKKRIGLNIPDGLLWFCDTCNHKLYEVYFELHNIEVDFLKHFKHFYNSQELRTCKTCGTVMETDERFVK
ncbi:MAG TPA: 3-hydroxyanthranilate 3,4-dioxygenase [Flavobacterium sp.]|nr:3-hydroxyanthranilate 3,4-dioxygenase [Flavobacterium sp.]